MTSGFGSGEQAWAAGLSKLRNTVRQELVTRQLRAELPPPPGLVLDAGCGQGTQAIQLARRGYHVTGVDASADLLETFKQTLAAEPSDVRDRIRLISADITRPRSETYDIVLCHGVLMYFADPAPVLDVIATAVRPGGVVSLLVRNGDALAMRPGLSGDWGAALAAFDAPDYVNRLGVKARADRLTDMRDALAHRGLRLRSWYGVRVFTDPSPSDAAVPEQAELVDLLAAEERAGRTDPYRRVAGLLHILAVR